MTKSKKLLIAFTIVLLAFLIICTFLSKTIYNARLVAVEARAVVSSELSFTADSEGQAVYLDSRILQYAQPLQVTKVYVEEGQKVQSDTLLLEVDVRAYELNAQRYELNLLRLNAQLSDSNLTSSQRELIIMERDIAEAELELYRETFPKDGRIYAGAAAIITALPVKANETLIGGTPLVELSALDSKLSATFTLNDEHPFVIGDRVVVKYQSTENINGQTLKVQKSTTTQIATITKQDNGYIFAAPLDIELPHGQTVSVQVTHSYGMHQNVVPLSALHETEGNGLEVYVIKTRPGLFGDESYVQAITVEKLAANQIEAAIVSDTYGFFSDFVVVSATGFLTDGQTVWRET